MVKHNVVVVGSLEYKAVESDSENTCEGCYASIKGLDCEKFNCLSGARKDGKDVIFKRHYRPTYKELQK